MSPRPLARTRIATVLLSVLLADEAVAAREVSVWLARADLLIDAG